MRRLILALIALTALACGPVGETGQDLTPVTSAGDPSAPVPFWWTVHESHSPDGHRLRLQGGTLHAIASEVRLLDATGQAIASAPTELLSASDSGLCGGPARGTVRVDVSLPASDLPAFGGGWPSSYRVEAHVGDRWRRAELTFAGCRSIE